MMLWGVSCRDTTVVPVDIDRVLLSGAGAGAEDEVKARPLRAISNKRLSSSAVISPATLTTTFSSVNWVVAKSPR